MTRIPEVRLDGFDPRLHAELLGTWLRRSHVARWWGDCAEQCEDLLRRPSDAHAIIVADGTPVGYLCWQRPSQEELDAAGLADLPEDLVDIDIMIGEPDAVGHGTGTRALGLLLDRLRADPRVRFAGLATSVLNQAALRSFEKAGFSQVREFLDPELGPCRYMLTEVRDRGGP